MTELRLFRVVRQADVQRAQARARRLWPTHPGYRGAYLKGWRARRAGLPEGACPYDRKLHGESGNGTWAWAWRSVWFQGYFEGA